MSKQVVYELGSNEEIYIQLYCFTKFELHKVYYETYANYNQSLI